MDQLEGGDILKRIDDGSKWRFLHYKPMGTDYGKSEDKNFVHVRMWDNEANDWKTGDHKEFSVTDFEKA